MMYFNHDSVVYSVKFYYSHHAGYRLGQNCILPLSIYEVKKSKNWANGKGHPGEQDSSWIKTTCVIEKSEITNVWVPVSIGESLKTPADKFNPSFGRKTSLTRALKSIPDVKIRRLAWYNYFHAHRDGFSLVAKIEKYISPDQRITIPAPTAKTAEKGER